MNTEKMVCLVDESDCGRMAGNPVCPKCGVDERVVYPGRSDLDVALHVAKAQFLTSQLSAAKTQGEEPSKEIGNQKNLFLEAQISPVYFFKATFFLLVSYGYFEHNHLSGWEYLISVFCIALGAWGLFRHVWIAVLPFLFYSIFTLKSAFPYFYGFWVAILSKKSFESIFDHLFWMLFITFFFVLHLAIILWFVWNIFGAIRVMRAFWKCRSSE